MIVVEKEQIKWYNLKYLYMVAKNAEKRVIS